MCGICGIIETPGDAPIDREVLHAMSAALSHRGPDDEGFFYGPGAGLAASRLAIIDIPGGRQPLYNEDRSLCCVLNGEIYNYRELRATLLALGHRFATESDTEVLVHLYEEFGEECVKHLNGIFAFAIWNSTNRTLFAARDKLGVKPLFLHNQGHRLLFASELKALLVHPSVERTLDLVSLTQYLSFEYVPTPRSIIKNVQKLPPGHFLVFTRGEMQIRQYWDVSFARSESRPPINWREYEGLLRERLLESVRTELVGDVPVGVFLSGGIDSSAVAAMMRKAVPGSLKSFSVAFDDPSFDESRYARLVADSLKTDHSELRVTPDMIRDLLPRLPGIMDEPLADSSIIPMYLLSRFARQQVKVAMGGDGGDEIFAGYPTLQAHKLIEYYERAIPLAARARLIPWLVSLLPASFENISLDFKVRRFLSGRGVPPEVRHHRWLGSFTDEERRQLLLPWAVFPELDTYEAAHRHTRMTDARNPINKIMYCDLKLYLEGNILPKVDRASMASSLEVRVPLLNPRLFNFVIDLPCEMKLRGFTTKHIFRKALSGMLPTEILRRSKAGFNIPLAKWLNGELRDLVDDHLSPERISKRALFSPVYVQELLQQHRAGTKDNRKLLWTLCVLEMWLEEYLN